ncbi:hypothetical protein WR25_19290 [Diploscapter pachys]|uniref:Uncharacterized protein n=1 Tax=Diploscapter pachys TaxID=2018661 RepID=A0A2A2JUL5_9BILA|nr:hypothetical protein WR25_19290 [Diploscapter pachys]
MPFSVWIYLPIFSIVSPIVVVTCMKLGSFFKGTKDSESAYGGSRSASTETLNGSLSATNTASTGKSREKSDLKGKSAKSRKTHKPQIRASPWFREDSEKKVSKAKKFPNVVSPPKVDPKSTQTAEEHTEKFEDVNLRTAEDDAELQTASRKSESLLLKTTENEDEDRKEFLSSPESPSEHPPEEQLGDIQLLPPPNEKLRVQILKEAKLAVERKKKQDIKSRRTPISDDDTLDDITSLNRDAIPIFSARTGRLANDVPEKSLKLASVRSRYLAPELDQEETLRSTVPNPKA